MNLFAGIILGILLTIGTAFITDAVATPKVTSDTCSKQVVNWDIAKERLHSTTESIRVGWNRLTGTVKNLE
jgi:hypothetical protein